MLQIRIKQGKGGQFRWLLYEDGTFAGMIAYPGLRQLLRSLAELAAKRHFGDMGGTGAVVRRSRP